MSKRPNLGTLRWHLVLTAAGVTFVFATVTALSLFVPLFAHLDGSEFSTEELGGVASYVLHLHESFWPVVAGSMAAAIASGLLLFERMRMPLMRFRKVYADLSQGRVPAPLTIRAHDYLQDETLALNRMLEAQRVRSAALRAEIERLEGTLAKSEAGLGEADESIQALRQLVG